MFEASAAYLECHWAVRPGFRIAVDQPQALQFQRWNSCAALAQMPEAAKDGVLGCAASAW